MAPRLDPRADEPTDPFRDEVKALLLADPAARVRAALAAAPP
jgi:hypothetical protein